MTGVCQSCEGPTTRARHALCLSCRRPSLETKLDRFVDRSGGPDACWPWRRYCLRSGTGYGVTYKTRGDGRSRHLVHRLVLERSLGRPLGPGMEACHHCDNPPCCNPAHLFEGSHADNMADARRKGRLPGHPRALSDAQVQRVRELRQIGATYREIAEAFGVALTTAWKATAP